MSQDLALEKGLPANLDAERFVLGSILLDETLYPRAAEMLEPWAFALEKHRRIFARMAELYERQERIDRVTVAEELQKHNQLESCDGLTYLVSLDDGLPRTANIDAYLRIVRDKAKLRRVIFAGQKLIDRALQGEEEPEEIIAGGTDMFLRMSGGAQDPGELLTLDDVIENFEGGFNAFIDPSKRKNGLQTGFIKLDEMTGGLRPGELWILAARPSMGKTALASNIACHLATAKPTTPVALFSLEMSRETLFNRAICAIARVDSQKFRANYLHADERRRIAAAAAQLCHSPLFIDDTPSPTLGHIHTKARRLKADKGLGLVVVDYLQLMGGAGDGKGRENRTQEVSALSRGMKLLARELNVPFLVLSQLSRGPDQRTGDHRPMLSDLRESGSIEQDADVVLFIFREEVYKQNREDLRGMAELILAKQRNGPTGIIPLVFLRSLTKFENRAADLADDSQGALTGMEDE